jgi:RNA polymerase sigma-70 factor (ECF subfamily)
MGVMQDIEAVYRSHRRGLYLLALAIVRRSDLAEDAVHEAFVGLARAAGRGVTPATDWVSYAYGAVRNTARDLVRRGPWRRALSSLEEAEATLFEAPDADPGRALEEAQEQRLAMEAVDQLPADQREVVVMRLMGDLSFQQIAQALGSPLATVASRYRRALERVRERLESRAAATGREVRP